MRFKTEQLRRKPSIVFWSCKACAAQDDGGRRRCWTGKIQVTLFRFVSFHQSFCLQPLTFHQRLAKIREKIFHNAEAGLSLEGFIDAMGLYHKETDRILGTPKSYSSSSTPGLLDDKLKTELTEYRSLLVNKADFEEKATIGRGHFGVVKLVKEANSNNGKCYAMKRMNKGQVRCFLYIRVRVWVTIISVRSTQRELDLREPFLARPSRTGLQN